VAVTLAGFAGIVVVFLPESVHQWSRVDRFRLRLLAQQFHFSPCLFVVWNVAAHDQASAIRVFALTHSRRNVVQR
jgi:hypothetical protein